ncbi:hypothetical protein MSAN_01207300 [Mycena sanguinolenta]|uniref:Uncharacterized protein n=1 Tax=Mycena sanguinolenta TaxID=230812 RepID=A0A8H6YCQ9_9AGAR|nr:hypothetical protein MSAN_01207300 [Mycena sanguinolenta]
MASTRSRQFSTLDALILRDYGRDTIEDAVGFTFETVLCSTYSILFALVVYSIFRRGVRSRNTIIMLLVVVYLYGASVTQWAVDFWVTLNSMHSLFMMTEVPIPTETLSRTKLATKLMHCKKLSLISTFVKIVSYAVVIWRTWVIYKGRIKAIVVPSVLLLTAFADQICPSSPMVVWGFSLGTNVVCTALIGFKAWYAMKSTPDPLLTDLRRHRKLLKQLKIDGITHGMSTQNVLSLLVESGFIYIFLLSIQIICYLDIPRSSPWYYFQYILVVMGQQVTGMYPTLIIAIVNFKRTIWEEHPITLGSCTVLNSLPQEVDPGRSGATRTFDLRSVIDICPEKVHDERCITHGNLACRE